MKKTVLFLSVAAILGLSACNSGSSESTSSFAMPTYNLITDLNQNESFVSTCTYRFDLNLSKYTAVISSDDLLINNSNWKLATDATTYYTDAYGYQLLVKNPMGYVLGNQTYQINNANFFLTPFFNFITNISVPGYTNYPSDSRLLVAQYNIGDEYMVRTFPIDAFYNGVTSTQYPGADGIQTNTSETMSYRILINPLKNTADMIIYNAKFSANPNEKPKQAIIARNLDVTWTGTGYTISKEDVIPEISEGGSTTPYPDFTFNEIHFSTNNKELTECMISYTVKNVFKGQFSGSYLVKAEDSNQQ